MSTIEEMILEDFPEEWEDKLHDVEGYHLIYTRYGLGRDYTEGYDWIEVLFSDKVSAKIFLNKHHKECF